ncbi:Polyunsaturated fatty acid 5-lipoxygenase [Labeo rohita]|uniref:Polyunsaturated fatty acid 5-lipoxygenase n=1 Tax=Labeo rohita TaxID=84645 RepID=A0ABQ8L667_LABRO|nr:Polyunsaturated fatty acid 5-lipoxygenase [Labeo rohita]
MSLQNVIDISETKDLGDIVQVKLEIGGSPWFCEQIRVKAPSGKFFEFPCYSWMDKSDVIIREGSARLPQNETGFLKAQRQKELESRQKTFRWNNWKPGFPPIIDGKLDDLHLDFQFDKEKKAHFTWNSVKLVLDQGLDTVKGYFQSWEDLENFEHILTRYCLDNTLLENVIQNWNTDYMFGYQFLNGCNPVMISKCVELPDNFPVTHEMVEGSLQRGLTLDEELKAGNIYIANYEILEGLHANKSSQNTPYYVTAPICLLYNNRLNQIVPIAIQLSQTGGDVSPIFLPNDDEYDWMLAKMWVKSADFNVHQLLTHLLKTHLLSEVFEVAMYRQLSAVHPVYKAAIQALQTTTAQHGSTLADLELSDTHTSDDVSKLQSEVNEVNGLKDKLKEGTERGKKMNTFVSELLKEVLSMDEYPLVDCAHRALRTCPNDTDPLHSLRVRLHYFRDHRAAFNRAKELLHDKPGVWYETLFPAKLRVIFNGTESVFTDARKAEEFAELHFGERMLTVALLVPHVRFTIAINAEARKGLISEDGIFSKISSLSGDGIKELMKRGLETLTYKSLCFPEAIKARGMEKAPNYYYREDGMRIWETLNRFVSDVVEIYYDSDEAVRSDVEIQKFVKDISLHGLQDKTEKFPKGLYSRVELVEYLTAVIFTASAQHAAVNFGQFDWYGWIPNSPSTMRKPPPQDKGTVNLKIIMETLPDRDCSSLVLGTAWSLTRFQENERFLGFYPDMYFTEQPVKQAIKTFRKKLDDLTDQIKSRNKTLTMDYCYLSPDKIPNSVAV